MTCCTTTIEQGRVSHRSATARVMERASEVGVVGVRWARSTSWGIDHGSSWLSLQSCAWDSSQPGLRLHHDITIGITLSGSSCLRTTQHGVALLSASPVAGLCSAQATARTRTRSASTVRTGLPPGDGRCRMAGCRSSSGHMRSGSLTVSELNTGSGSPTSLAATAGNREA